MDRRVTPPRPTDPDGLEDVLGDPFAVVATRDLLDDEPEQAVAVVGVDIPAARLELHGLTGHEGGDVVLANGQIDAEGRGDDAVVEHRVKGHVTIPTPGVVEQVVDGDLVEPRVGSASRRRL